MSARLVWGMLILGAVGFFAAAAPLLPLQAPHLQNLAEEFARPSCHHWLGQGENGIDLLSHIIWGSRISLGIAVSVVLAASFFGSWLGVLAGWCGGWVDLLLMRVVDGVSSFPGILLLVAGAAFWGPGVGHLIVLMILTGWTGYARMARSLALSLKDREFIVAARAMGIPTLQILRKHLFPATFGPLVVQMTFGLGGAIISESTLSFLGIGVPVGTPSWGALLASGREAVFHGWHLILVPATPLVLCVLSVNLLGDGLRDLWDPKGVGNGQKYR